VNPTPLPNNFIRSTKTTLESSYEQYTFAGVPSGRYRLMAVMTWDLSKFDLPSGSNVVAQGIFESVAATEGYGVVKMIGVLVQSLSSQASGQMTFLSQETIDIFNSGSMSFLALAPTIIERNANNDYGVLIWA